MTPPSKPSRVRGRSIGRARVSKASFTKPSTTSPIPTSPSSPTPTTPSSASSSSSSSVRFNLPSPASPNPSPAPSTRLMDLPSCPLPAVAPRRPAAKKKQRNRSLSVSARRGRALFDKLGAKQRPRGWAPSRNRKDEDQVLKLLDQRTRSPSPPRGK